jgi:hypothetical protein
MFKMLILGTFFILHINAYFGNSNAYLVIFNGHFPLPCSYNIIPSFAHRAPWPVQLL